jgi:hypothetical protein
MKRFGVSELSLGPSCPLAAQELIIIPVSFPVPGVFLASIGEELCHSSSLAVIQHLIYFG